MHSTQGKVYRTNLGWAARLYRTSTRTHTHMYTAFYKLKSRNTECPWKEFIKLVGPTIKPYNQPLSYGLRFDRDTRNVHPNAYSRGGVEVAVKPLETVFDLLGYTGHDLTSFGRQTNHQCVTIVNIHQIAFTRAPAVLTANFYCYHEHYHVGARPS